MSLTNQGTAPVHELRDDERQPCEIWTRVMGYHRPVGSFNRGKQGEFGDRVYFDLDRIEPCGHAD